MTDYISRLQDQLGQVTELGVHNRRRFVGRPARPGVSLAAAAAVIVVAVAVAVALGAGGSTRSRPGGSPAAGSNPAQNGALGGFLHTRGETRTHSGTAYCVDSITHTRTPCSPRTGSLRAAGGPPASKVPPGGPTRLVSQLALHAPSGATRPAGVASVTDRKGVFGIAIAGLGLPANTQHDAYAVWLTNRRRRQLVGFVSQRVTRNGRLETEGILPKGAFRYREILITRETRGNPMTPGAVVLEGTFHR